MAEGGEPCRRLSGIQKLLTEFNQNTAIPCVTEPAYDARGSMRQILKTLGVALAMPVCCNPTPHVVLVCGTSLRDAPTPCAVLPCCATHAISTDSSMCSTTWDLFPAALLLAALGPLSMCGTELQNGTKYGSAWAAEHRVGHVHVHLRSPRHAGTDLRPETLHPTPYTLHPTPYTLHPTPDTLHPTP
eukprot:1839967-Rhodomonas_salina.2